MSGFNIRAALRRTSAVAALLSLGSTAALAQTVLGGGSQLSGPVYVTGTYADTEAAAVGLSVAATCPSTNDIFFGLVGSGKGASAFLYNTPSLLGTGCTGNVHYGSGDFPLGAVVPGAAAAFSASNGYQLIQIPVFGTPVTLAFHYPGLTTDGAVTLTDADLCSIFSGKVQNWSGVSQSGLSGPIAVSYRQDSSGTTFLFTNHLAAVCAAGILPGGGSFAGTTKFATLFPGYTTDGSGNTHVPPATFAVDASAVGSSGVEAAINATTDSVGALGPDYTDIAPKNKGVAGFPVVASVVNSSLSTAELPTEKATTAALNTFKVKNLVATNPDSFSILTPNPNKGYPIVGYAYFYIGTQYISTTVAADLRNLLSAGFNPSGSSKAGIDDITINGFVVVPGATLKSAPKPATLAGIILKDYLAANASVPIVGGSSNPHAR